jgi:glycosyltransferase involved in cell wall biosynthesis
VYRRNHVSRLRRLLRRPFRSVLQQQALVNQKVGVAIEELRESQARFECETGQAIGDLGGCLLGELSDLQLAVHQLESLLGSTQRPTSGVSPLVPTASNRAVGTTPAAEETGPLPDGAGVNLIGDLTATTGLAQAGRRLAVGLRRRGVPMTVTSVRSGAPRMDGLYPTELRNLPDGRAHPVDLVTLNVNEVPAVATGDLGLLPTGRYAIGSWFWEFEALPPDLVEQIDRVDEIWAPSTFVKRAFGRYTAKPIHIVPAIVPVFEASEARGVVRQRLGVSHDEVVFLFTFDFNSSVVRKNPIAVVDAYRRAFGSDPSGVRLVIKAINLANSPMFESDLRAAIEGVSGALIDEHLSQAELGDLFHAADVYVSMHRSEGFGLGMAEAMAIGKAVVGTAYSGNVDFMNGANSCPIGFRLRSVTPEDHRYSGAVGTVYRQGFLCAEPDIEQAARWMRALASDAALRGRIGSAAAATMATRFSEAAAVRAAMARLEALWPPFGAAGDSVRSPDSNPT